MKNLNVPQRIVALLFIAAFITAVILARLNTAGFTASQFTI